MAKPWHATISNSIVTSSRQTLLPTSKSHHVQKYPPLVAVSCSRGKDEAQRSRKIARRKTQKAPRPLIKIPTSDGKWGDEWTASYVLTLRELRLADLADQDDGELDKQVSVGLSIQKHASFGLSIQGIITTSFNAQCTSCFSPYHREIDANFNVWVLPSRKSGELVGIPEIGENDSSVIYVKPGCEANLDSLIKDTIRLAASSKDTCTELCAKSSRTWQYTDGKVTYDQRWSRLMEIRDSFGST